MPRMTEQERETAMNDFNGHYTEVLKQQPNFQIEAGFGLVQLRALEALYIARRDAITQLVQTDMGTQRARRDALFGVSNQDTDGVWLYLLLYKANARLHLGRFAPKGVAKALGSTCPNLGVVIPGTYDSILEAYINHWTLVDAAVPPDKPLVIGPLTLPLLRARRAEMATLIAGIDETDTTRLAVMRAEKEQLFGDVREDDREPDSIVAMLSAYSIEIATQFAGTPLAATLPRIFPDESAGEVRFPFNWKQVGGNVTVWFEMPDISTASAVYLKEGAFEETVAMPGAAPFKVVFSGVAVQEEVDEVELRDGTGKTVAFGRYKSDLVEPV